MPRSETFARVVEACMRSWGEGGATIDIAEHVPTLAARCKLVVEWFRPVARLGGVGSMEWRWGGGFFRTYLPKLVERGLLTEAELEDWRRDWEQRTVEGTSFFYTPTMADVVLRKG